MNHRTAQQHLLDWRPCEKNSSPEQEEALRLVASDPLLAAWFEAHCQAQADIRSRLREMRVPEGLKTAILSGAPSVGKVVRPNFSGLLALAASIALLLGLGLFYFGANSDNEVKAFRSRMVGNALRNYRMDLLSKDLGEIRSYLAAAKWPADYQLPVNLEKVTGWGCARLTWQGKPVSMICFARGGRPDLFLFVADQIDVTGSAQVGSVRVEMEKKLSTATWVQGGRFYVLSVEGDESLLRRYLP